MVAASFSKVPEVIETLLKSGADTRRKDNQGRTAFDCAKENKSLDGTKALWDLDYTHGLAYGLLIVQYRFYDIFPVFYGYYDTHPLGQVVIINTLDTPVTDVRMSFFVKEFMTSPRECPVPSTLLPNEPATADLFAVFQPSILRLFTRPHSSLHLQQERR
jgi:ankyrin repeat protein